MSLEFPSWLHLSSPTFHTHLLTSLRHTIHDALKKKINILTPTQIEDMMKENEDTLTATSASASTVTSTSTSISSSPSSFYVTPLQHESLFGLDLLGISLGSTPPNIRLISLSTPTSTHIVAHIHIIWKSDAHIITHIIKNVNPLVSTYGDMGKMGREYMGISISHRPMILDVIVRLGAIHIECDMVIHMRRQPHHVESSVMLSTLPTCITTCTSHRDHPHASASCCIHFLTPPLRDIHITTSLGDSISGRRLVYKAKKGLLDGMAELVGKSIWIDMSNMMKEMEKKT